MEKLLELRPQIIIHNLAYLASTGLLCVVHVVRWIGENHIGQLAFQHALEAIALCGIAGEQPMSSHHPQIASNRYRQDWCSWHIVFVYQALRLEIGQDSIQFLGAESDLR